jgi:hypothetical protein
MLGAAAGEFMERAGAYEFFPQYRPESVICRHGLKPQDIQRAPFPPFSDDCIDKGFAIALPGF